MYISFYICLLVFCITNYHKLRGLTPHPFIISQFYKKSGMTWLGILLGVSQAEIKT